MFKWIMFNNCHPQMTSQQMYMVINNKMKIIDKRYKILIVKSNNHKFNKLEYLKTWLKIVNKIIINSN